jgi:hypothetical protein
MILATKNEGERTISIFWSKDDTKNKIILFME